MKNTAEKVLRIIPAIHMAAHGIALYVSRMKQLGLSQAEAHVLAHLHERGSSTVGDIHGRFGHRRSTLTSVLDRLAHNGLVKRTTAEDDRRGVLVALTARGKGVSSKVHASLLKLEHQTRSLLAPAEFAAAEVALHKLAELAGGDESP